MATVKDRGQLVLIAGLALAISLVAIALVLNSAIYTHNLASRYDNPGDGVVRSNHDVRESAGANVRYVNEKYAADGYGAIQSNYIKGISDIEATVAEDGAINGRLLRVSHVPDSDVEGVRIVDDEAGGSNFTSRTGAENWTVVKDAQVRAFTIRVDADAGETSSLTKTTVLNGPLGSDAFTVNFDDGDEEWRVAVYENQNVGATELNATVRNVGTGEAWTCTAAGSEVELDFSSGQIGSQSCTALLFIQNLSKPYNVSFNRSGNISGSYRMIADGVVNNSSVTTGAFTDRVDTANYGAHCGDAEGGTEQSTFYNASAAAGEYPRVTPALYEVAINTTYDSESVTFEGRHRIAPGETGKPPQTPVIRSFDVTEAVGGGNFTVSWNVTDPNGDSLTVDIYAKDDSGTNVSEITDPDVNGTDKLSGLDSGTYTIIIAATDGTNSREAAQVHEYDGDEKGCPA